MRKRSSLPTRKISRTRKRSSKRTGSRKRSSDPRVARPIYVGLGSNLGDPQSFLRRALEEIERKAPIDRVSSFYRSDPVGYADQPRFVNAVAEVAWQKGPRALLEMLQRIEQRLGRTPTFRNGPREIDLDLLDFRGQIRSSADLELPHPRLESRRFVLGPLAEIAPDWRHPVSGMTARELLRGLPRTPAVSRIRRSGRARTAES